MMLYRRTLAWCIQHPIFDGLASGATVTILSAMFISFGLPAWAVTIPVGNIFVLDVGALPQWIGAIVAVAVWWEARKAKQHAAEAVAISKDVATKVGGVLASRDAINVAEGEKKAHDDIAATKEVASADAVRDAETKAKIAAATANTPAT